MHRAGIINTRIFVLGRDDVLVVAVAAEAHGDGAHVDVEVVDDRLDGALLEPVDVVLDERHAGRRKLARGPGRILAREHELEVVDGDAFDPLPGLLVVRVEREDLGLVPIIRPWVFGAEDAPRPFCVSIDP